MTEGRQVQRKRPKEQPEIGFAGLQFKVPLQHYPSGFTTCFLHFYNEYWCYGVLVLVPSEEQNFYTVFAGQEFRKVFFSFFLKQGTAFTIATKKRKKIGSFVF